MAKDIISGTEDRLEELTQYKKQSQENEKYLPSPHLLWDGACTIQRGEGFHIHIIKSQEGEEKESVQILTPIYRGQGETEEANHSRLVISKRTF